MLKLNLLGNVLLFFELVSSLTGFIFWNKIKNTYWKYFPVYLFVITGIELTAKYLKVTKSANVAFIGEIYKFLGVPVQFLFFFWLFSRQAESSKEKKWPLWGCIIYIICWIADTFYISDMKLWFSSFSYTIGNIILVVLIIRFLLKFMNSNEILHYSSGMMFWVTTGMLVFYMGTLPFYGLRNTLYYNYKDIFWTYSYIQLMLDCCMYILFTIAFIWGKPR